MENTYWHKQTPDKPLFPDLLWSRPENKQHAGKLLIVGGNLHGFASVAEAYNQSLKAGVGTAKVLLPDALQKTVGPVLENTEFAPSNKSGSFARSALAEWISLTDWADVVLISGDLGRNSETAILLESYLAKSSKPLIITKDAADYFGNQPLKLFSRSKITMVVSIAQLQKMAIHAKFGTPIKFSMTLVQLVEALRDLTSSYPVNIITLHDQVIFVASAGKVSTTPVNKPETWRAQTASSAAVWLAQNSSQPFKALTSSVVDKIS